ncbi:MAG: gamma-glutamyltransferase [Thermomicrobiales bacterium]|nr:gamma-glutamyltransferase [Thermomicrobiales bacterium]
MTGPSLPIPASKTARPQITAQRGVVAGGDQREADAGIRIMQEGGNAVDALVAAAFVGYVVEPDSCGIGGYGRLAIYLEEQQEFVTVDHYVRAPLAATDTMFEVIDGGDRLYYGWPQVVDRANEWGYRSIAVPGAVAGLYEAHRQFGQLAWERVLAPAIEAAEAGLEVTWDLVLSISGRIREIRTLPDVAEFLLPGGEPPRHRNGFNQGGHHLDLFDLAQTLRRVASEGPAGFYDGPVADAIVTEVQSHGGILSHDDLTSYRPKVMREKAQHFAGVDYITAWDQVGYEALNILDQSDLPSLEPDGLRVRHLMAEALGAAFVDNMFWYGDPEYVDSPVSGLSNRAFAAERARSIRFERAMDRPIPVSDPRPYDDASLDPDFDPQAPSVGGSHGTSQMAAMDQAGNIATLCTSLSSAFGSLVRVPGTGIFLNNSMQNFDPRPGRANAIAPGKMPIFAAPTIAASQSGKGRFGAAGSGGYRIETAVLHTTVGHLTYGMTLQDAIDLPRVHCQGRETVVDSRIPETIRRELAALGHQVVDAEETPGALNFARVVAVGRDPQTGELIASSGPFWSTAVAGW